MALLLSWTYTNIIIPFRRGNLNGPILMRRRARIGGMPSAIFSFLPLLEDWRDDRIDDCNYGDQEEDHCKRSLHEANRSCDHQGLDIVGLDKLSKDQSQYKWRWWIVVLLEHPTDKTEYKTGTNIKHTLLYRVASKDCKGEDQWIEDSLLNIFYLYPKSGAEGSDEGQKNVGDELKQHASFTPWFHAEISSFRLDP